MLWIAKTGAPWRDLPLHFGSWKTVASRFYRWTRRGLWQQILARLQEDADRHGQINWELHHVDSTTIRAHHHAAGARGGQAHEALGRSRGGFTTKIHVRIEGDGKPMVLHLTPGQRHDAPEFIGLMEEGHVKRTQRGRPRWRPHRIVADKGYTSQHIRRYLVQHGIGMVIPRRKNQQSVSQFDHAAYRQRNQVERFFNRLKQFRRIATRYEKRAVNYLAMVTLGAILLWLEASRNIAVN
jgi:transposase